ncbi:MAG: PAS domain S-box protein [Desulfoprunum sp.]|nr:PAS domain S-box protein [Desulfoprunum sp.]
MSDTHIENQHQLANIELKRRIALLEERLLEKERAGESLQDSEKRYRRLFQSAKDGILILDAETGKVVDANPFLLQLLGFSYDAICGQYIWELGVFKDIAASREAFKNLQDNEYIRYDDLPLETHDGRPIAVEFVSNVYLVDHSKVIQCNIRDITARKQADAERRQLIAAVEQAGDSVVMTDPRGIIQFVNPAFERTTGYTQEEVVGQNPRILKSGKQDELFYRNLWDTISSGRIWTGLMVNKRKDGSLYTEETTISPIRDASGRIVNHVAVQRDMTEHLRLTSQLQQSQKMEAVGLLAGGVAHDYNNMLSVILGYTELALGKVDPAESLHADLDEIYKAAMRSTEITRQLLAFARKQTINPVVLDLNQNVQSMLKMLRRLIGENITLAWLPEAGLYPIKMDPAQTDQLLANLCVNARDAIADVGKVIIETKNVVFDETYCINNIGFVSGQYVLLAVSDDGGGMDKETLNHIFEPFFTTKEMGQGTGLGLSTVYGIVKQNHGFINVYSEPGKGTTFKIYLPWYAGQTIEVQREKVAEIPLSQGETVLVVEDEPLLLKMNERMLEQLGYRALAAGSPGEAIGLAAEHAGEIRLLVTDVVMPEMNGRDLAERLQSLYPDMKILFMSGYMASVIVHRGVLDEGVNFIQKPFSMKDLAVKIQDAMRGN